MEKKYAIIILTVLSISIFIIGMMLVKSKKTEERKMSEILKRICLSYKIDDNIKDYLLLFVNPECEECQKEMAFLILNKEKIINRYHVFIFSDVSEKELYKFSDKYQLNISEFRFIADEKLDFYIQFDIIKQPTCLIFNNERRFIQRLTGRLMNIKQLFIKKWKYIKLKRYLFVNRMKQTVGPRVF